MKAEQSRGSVYIVFPSEGRTGGVADRGRHRRHVHRRGPPRGDDPPAPRGQGARDARGTLPRRAGGARSALEVAMSRHQVVPAEVGLLWHGTTVVTNAILQKSGARAALVTTRGFLDVLELRRSARADLYDLFQDPPATLIPRRRRF